MKLIKLIETHTYQALVLIVVLWLLPPVVVILGLKIAGVGDILAASGVIGDTFNVSTSILTAFALFFVALSLTQSSKQIEQMQQDLLIQQEALRAQIQELKLNREELSRAAQAQEDSVNAMGKQAKVAQLGSEIAALTTILGGMESRYDKSKAVYKKHGAGGSYYNTGEWQYFQERAVIEERLSQIIRQLSAV